MNILYLGRDSLACKAVIFMLSNHLSDGTVTFISIDDMGSHHPDQQYDVAILDNENIFNYSADEIEWLNSMSVPLVLLTIKDCRVKELHAVFPQLRSVIDRNGNTDFFIKAVSAVAAGGYCYSWDILDAEFQKREQFDEAECEKANLTAREKEILKFCLAGETNKSISRILGRSEKTISAHKSNMMKKMGIKSWQLHGRAETIR